MVGPSKADISCVSRGDGVCECDYSVSEAGSYHILVKYHGLHVPGV